MRDGSIATSKKEWRGAESNRRHRDFQSVIAKVWSIGQKPHEKGECEPDTELDLEPDRAGITRSFQWFQVVCGSETGRWGHFQKVPDCPYLSGY
jgi:hypothetical protein